MGRITIVAALLFGTIVAGCGTSLEPTQGELKAKWESGNVPPPRYRDDLIAFMHTYLNDPSGIREAQVSQPLPKRVPGDPGDRFVVCTRYNARDTSGKYLGAKTGAATFYNGKLDRFLDTPREVRALCTDAAYEPFPELERMKR